MERCLALLREDIQPRYALHEELIRDLSTLNVKKLRQGYFLH